MIVAAVFWGWLWGPVGLLLSTPLTVCLVVLGRYVPRFKILSTLLGEEVEIRASMRFYQRMLAGDQHRASELLNQHVDEMDFNAACDEVIVPALKRIRFDHNADHLSGADASRLFAMAGGLIDGLKQETNHESSDAKSAELPVVIGCTSHHFSESLVLNLLRIGSSGRYQLISIDEDTLPQEVGRRIVANDPAVVVIVVLPKGGFVQARYLCKSIRGEGYTGQIVISCLGKFKNFDKLFVKFRKAGATSVTTSYSQTQAKIDSILKRHAPSAASLPTQPEPVAEVTT